MAEQPARADASPILAMLGRVMDRMTAETTIGRILMPGPTYLGIWARDTGVAALGLNRLGRTELAGELLRRYWSYQISEHSDPASFIFRNKRFPTWTDADAFRPKRDQLLAEVGAFPTCVYIQTPDFPAGTQEIYTVRADPDSVAWLIIALQDYHAESGDDETVRQLSRQVGRAIDYLLSRDLDGDHLIEQGANQDWADILLRRGKVSYTQAVWYRCLEAAACVFDVSGDAGRARFCRLKQNAVRDAANKVLLNTHGYYVNYRYEDRVSLHRSLDTALLVAFDLSDVATGRRVVTAIDGLTGPFGPAVVEPGFAPADIGPSKYPPGQYQNEGIWPWIASYWALAWARLGHHQRALDIVESVLSPDRRTVYEWIDNVNGERHHPDFATGAGALAWALTEGGLVSRPGAAGLNAPRNEPEGLPPAE